MTVIVGLVGADCAVMAADSEATESGHTRFDVEKIWTCGGLLLGFSGSDATRRLLSTGIEGKVQQHWDGQDEIPRQEARTGLVEAVGPTYHPGNSRSRSI